MKGLALVLLALVAAPAPTLARFVSMNTDSTGRIHAAVMDHQMFVDGSNDGLVRRGFFEREIHRTTRRFGNVAHVFSTYEMRERADGPVIGRGINSIELFWDGTRWWIAAAQGDDERPDNPIPIEYLPRWSHHLAGAGSANEAGVRWGGAPSIGR